MKAKRRSLSPKARAALLTAQGGVCAVRGCSEPASIAEHWTPVALGDSSAPDCMLCAEHAKAKTYGEPGRIGGDICGSAPTMPRESWNGKIRPWVKPSPEIMKLAARHGILDRAAGREFRRSMDGLPPTLLDHWTRLRLRLQRSLAVWSRDLLRTLKKLRANKRDEEI